MEAELQMVAWWVVIEDLIVAAGVNVHVAEPETAEVLAEPARVIVMVHGADVESETVELVNATLLAIVPPESVSFPTE